MHVKIIFFFFLARKPISELLYVSGLEKAASCDAMVCRVHLCSVVASQRTFIYCCWENHWLWIVKGEVDTVPGSFVPGRKAGSGKTFPVVRLSIPTWLIQNLWVMPKFCCPKGPTIKPGNFSKALHKWEIIHCCFMWSLQTDFITRLVWIFLDLHQHRCSFRWCRVMCVSEFKSIYQWCAPSPTFKSHDIFREINHPFFSWICCFDPLFLKNLNVKEGRCG